MTWRRLKQVAAVRISNVDKKTVEGEQPVRLCNYTDVYYHELITTDLPFIEATATGEQFTHFGLRRGDVLVTKDSETADDIAVPAYVAEDLPGVLSGYHLAILRPRPGTDGRYLFWALASRSSREQFSAAATGVTRFGLRYETFGAVRVPLPSLQRQQAVADYLDTETARIDALIDKKHRMVSLLETRFRVMRWHTLSTGVETSQPRLGVPLFLPRMGWQRWRLKYLVQQPLGGAWGSEAGEDEVDAVCYRVADFDRWLATAYSDKPTIRSVPRSLLDRLALMDGDLLLEKSGGGDRRPVGFVARVVDARVPAICSNFIARLRTMSEFDPSFVGHLLAALYDQGVTVPFIKQTTGIQNLDVEEYMSQTWAMPPIDEQLQIREYLDSEQNRVSELMAKVTRQIALLIERRQALITTAVTGELDIPELAA